jgi:UDP-N-acetylmuramate dehydrogenase
MIDFEENVSLKNFTSIKVGGPAEFFYSPTNIEEIKTALVWTKLHGHQVTFLGGGTNTLVSDDGVKGLVLSMRKYTGVESYVEGDTVFIEAKAGTYKTLLLKEFLKYKLAPAEFLAGLPGDIAGGVVMNAGIGEETIKPREFCEIIHWVEVLRDQKVIRVEKKDLEFSYRRSKGWQPGLIIKACFSWPNKPDEDVLNRVRALNKARMAKQPLEHPNAGSVFVNPPGYKAGKLIEECGLKGYKIGDAQVSEKHGNFIINLGQAKATDVLQLIKHIQDVVLEEKGISLHPEWVLLGF